MQYHARAVKLRAEELFPGVIAAITVAIAASFLSSDYGSPVMQIALLPGMAFRFIAEENKGIPGVQFASKHMLRIDVALLGMRMTVEQIVAPGARPVAIAIAAPGMKTPLKMLFEVGGKPVSIIVVETLFPAGLVLAGILLIA